MSYKIYAGTQTSVGVWDTKTVIYDPAAENIAMTLISPTLTREAGKAGSLEFTMPLGNVGHSALQKLKTVVEVEQDGVALWRGRVMNHDMDFLLRQKVYCEGELAYLNDSSLTPYKYTNLSIREFLEKVLSNHNSQTDRYKRFTLGNVAVRSEEQKPFKIGYATGCYVKREKDDDGNSDYYLMDASGRQLCYLNSSLSGLAVGESTYVGADYVLTVTKTRAGSTTGQSENSSAFDAQLNFAYCEGSTYDLTVTTAGSKHIYTLGNISDTWYVSSKGTIWYNDTECVGYELRDFDDTNNEAMTFGDGKNFGTTWDILQSELTDVYGGYLTVRYSADGTTRYLDYLTDSSAEKNTQTVEFGVNMLNLDNYVKAENIVTRVIAVGYRTSGFWIFKSTDTIMSTANDREAQKIYGIITRVIVIDGKSSTYQKLLDAANDELKKNLRYLDGIEVNAVDLKDAGIDVERLGWMKTTHVISKPHDLDTWILCTKVVEPLDAPDKKKFTFGTSFYSISDLQALSSQKASTAYSMALSTAGYINNAK